MAVLEKPKRKRRTKAEMEAARTAEKQPTKTKRKRRTKAEMEAFKSKDAAPPPEKLQPWEIGYPREKITTKPKKSSIKIYMAGPMFTSGQRFENSMIAESLIMAGYNNVFLPQSSGIDDFVGLPLFLADLPPFDKL